MKKYTLDSGHTVFEVSMTELLKFGSVPPLCDSCIAPLLGDNHYIPVLHSVYCEECYKDWKSRAVYYKEDRVYEEDKIAWIERMVD